MELFINIFIPIIALIYGYFFGSIPTSVILGRWKFHQDPREFGSHNPGGTNSARLWGRKFGAIVICLDILKSIIAFWTMLLIVRFTSLSKILNADSQAISIWLVPLGTVIGHCFSIFLKFKGGKGVAVYVGGFGGTSLLQLLIGFPVFVLTAFKSKFVSLSSLILCGCVTVNSWIIYVIYYFCGFEVAKYLVAFDALPIHWIYPVAVTLSSLLILVRHISNIKRIYLKNESKLKLFDKKTVN